VTSLGTVLAAQHDHGATVFRVYANILGNGDEALGDGWRLRGRGLIQITWRDDYTGFGSTLGMTAEEAAVYCEKRLGRGDVGLVVSCIARMFGPRGSLDDFGDHEIGQRTGDA
jgi:hypothetical protein